MNPLPLIDPQTARGETHDLLAAVKAGMGVVPNMTRAMANSPALLRGYLDMASALGNGVLPAATSELLALTVAQANSCEYCLSAHAYLAEHVAHLGHDEIAAARKGEHTDPKVSAILRLAASVVDNRGDLADDELDRARRAGITDGEIAETIGHVAINMLTNYFNKAAGVELDFPVVSA
jgi:uncharacterized peroxidase-related enzyme